MAKGGKPTFGSMVRAERMRLKIGLRDMARRIGVSPTYLSMIERDEFPPPAEDKVTAIAQIIGSDRDELLALAGRVSSDLQAKIMEQPRELAGLIREYSDLSQAERERMRHFYPKLLENISSSASGEYHYEFSQRGPLKKLSHLLIVLFQGRLEVENNTSSSRRKLPK